MISRSKKGNASNFLEADLDPLLKEQIFDKLPFRMPVTGDERLAWGLLKRIVLDACWGPKRARLKYIAETEAWIDGDGAYPFGCWCSRLGVSEPFMAERLHTFLSTQRVRALVNKRTYIKISWEVGSLGGRRPDLFANEELDERTRSYSNNRGSVQPVKDAVPQLQHPSGAVQDGEQATEG